MYPIVVLSLIALGLLVLGGRRREGLEPNDRVRVPTALPADTDRTWAMLPEATKTDLVAHATQMLATHPGATMTPLDLAKGMTQQVVEQFYRTVYVPATSPITLATIDNFVVTNAPSTIPENVNNAVRTVLKAYFIDQVAGTPATGATGTSTPGAPATPGGTSSTSGTPAPAPGLYIQLKTQFDTKKAAYDALVISASRNTDPTEEDINQLRTMNRELVVLLEQTIQALSTIQSEELGTLNRELASTLNTLEQQYGILSENSDRVETLRRIRQFEEVKSGGSVGIYMIALFVLALATLVIMVFFQRTNAPATAAIVSPPSMANFT